MGTLKGDVVTQGLGGWVNGQSVKFAECEVGVCSRGIGVGGGGVDSHSEEDGALVDETVVNIPIYSPFASFIIYSLNYFPDIFSIYLFKAYYLEVTDIFLHFSIKNALYLLGTCSERVANIFRHIRKFPL